MFPAVAARALVSRCVFLLLIGIGFIVAPELVPDPNLAATIPWFTVFLGLQLLPAFWESKPDLFAPPVYIGVLNAFSYFASLVGFLVVGELRLDFVQGLDPEATSALAILTLQAFIVGQVAYYLGYYGRWGVPFRRYFPDVAGLEWNRVRVIAVAVFSSVLFVAAYASFQARVGLPLFEFTRLDAGKSAWYSDPTLSWMLRGVQLGFLPALLYLASAVSKRRWMALPLLAIAVLALLVSRLGQRGIFAYALLVVLMVLHYLYRRIPILLFCAIYFVGLGTSNILHEWRSAPEAERREFALMDKLSDPTQVLVEHDAERQRFAATSLVMYEFPKNHPYLLGKSWVGLVALPIPRWLWPEKGSYFAWQDNGIIYQLAGTPVPAPFVATLYANFSWFGIFIGMFLFGAFHRALYEWLRLSPADKNVVLLYGLMLLFLAPTTLALSASLTYVLPIWLILRIVGKRPQPASAPATAAATRS